MTASVGMLGQTDTLAPLTHFYYTLNFICWFLNPDSFVHLVDLFISALE